MLKHIKYILTVLAVLLLTGCSYSKTIYWDNAPHTDNKAKVYKYLNKNYGGDFSILDIRKEKNYSSKKVYDSWFEELFAVINET